MKKLVIYIFAIIFFMTAVVPTSVSSSPSYSDGYTKIGDTVIPFPEYMPGTYFTKNGLPCTCHDNSSINCVASGPYCNCKRFINIDGKELDLLAVQCIGFARYCFYRLFGFADHDLNSSLFYNAGTLTYGQVNAATVKTLVSSLKPGAHIRFKLAYTEHSVVLLSQNSEGFTVYQCNSGGNGIPQADCVVSTKTYTWESFAVYAYRGIVFAHMPYNYPQNLEFSDTPFEETVYKAGKYQLTANLRLRSGSGTDYEWIDTLPEGEVVEIVEVNGNWGKTSYNGKTGWISLEFAAYLGSNEVFVPKSNSNIYIKDGYVYGLDYGVNGAKLLACFENTNLSLSCSEGDTVGTGTTISIMDNGTIIDTVTLILKGDTNGDGLLTTADCATIKLYLNNTSLPNGAFLLAADTNGNGILSTSDYKLALLMLSQRK